MESCIGPNVKMFRQMAHMTQMDLAKALGYKNQASIARIENGERDIPLSVVSKMAEVFGITPGGFFMDYKDNPFMEYVPYIMEMENKDPQKIRIIRELLGMPPKKIYQSTKEIV